MKEQPRGMKKQPRNAVIVGAGPGGLAAALLLAKSGVKVTVVEKRGVVGGRTSTIEQDGFKFDVGPTFFLYPRVLKEIFSAAGYDLATEVPMTRLDPQYRLVFGAGGELLATPNVERMEQAIAAISPEDAKQFHNFITHNRTKLAKFLPFLQSPFESWRDLAKPEMLKLLPLLAPWKSLDSDLQTHFKDERIRLGFSFQSKYLGMSPFRCPSLFSILSFLEYEHGVFHPTGGCGAVTKAMARICREMGVDILLNEPVERVLIEGGKAIGVKTANHSLPADAVVVNADFAGAMRRLVPNRLRNRWTDEKLAKKRYSCSTFMMYLGIDGRYDDVSHHTIYLEKNYKQNLRDIEDLHQLSDEPSFYVQNAGVTDATLAPDGQSTLYVLLPVTHDVIGQGGLGCGGSAVSRDCARPDGEDWDHRFAAKDSHGEDRDAYGMGERVRSVQGSDVFDGALAGPDAASAAAQSLRGHRPDVPGRRRDASGKRAAGDLRVGADYFAAAA